MHETKKFYVTTPIYYVNGKPHLGSLYSTVLADVAARWNQLQGKKTFLLTGTDEHGQKIAQAAQAAGKEPKAFVDGFIESFKETWKSYEIKYNHFIRTTDPDHVRAVQAWIIKLKEKGDIYKGAYQGYYCTPCETFVTEKDIDAQTGSDLKPACPACSRATVYMEEECYFFKLSAYQDRLLKFYETHLNFVTPSERLQEVISFVKAGLKDLSISRTTISWGIPFPGDEKHVCYVWADALNNYLSAIGYADPARTEEFNFWWPADLQILGKDIVRFHAVYWPAFLMAADLAMPHKLLVHGWIKIGGQKMSKSLGNVVDPQHLLQTYGADAVRYYLTRYIAVTQDSPFTIEELEQHINADLVNDLGNLLNRMVTLAEKNNLKVVPVPAAWDAAEVALHDLFQEMLAELSKEMEQCMYHRAYAHLWKYINVVNAYFHAQEPWKVVKHDPARFAAIISATAHALSGIGLLAWPVMPHKMETLLAMLGKQYRAEHDYMPELRAAWNQTYTLSLQGALFMKIMPPEVTETSPSKQEAAASVHSFAPITIDDFGKVALLVGTVTNVATIEKSDKLYALTVDLGEHGVRTVCSGVRLHFAPEDLLNKQGIFVANLQPRQMMGLTSQGMMLFAKDAQGKLALATVGHPVPNGTRLT
jgi:methionyl-tRNA synthetase